MFVSSHREKQDGKNVIFVRNLFTRLLDQNKRQKVARTLANAPIIFVKLL